MSHELVISVLCPARADLVPDLTRAINECGCSIRDCRVTRLGQHQSVLLRAVGPWNALAKLDDQLPKIQQRHEVPHLVVERGGDEAVQADLVPYAVDAVCPDRPGVVAELAGFFSARAIGVLELVTQTYSAHQTGTSMFSVQMSIGVPTEIHIPALREEFMDLCDRLNLDAVIEPIKT
jgi:glycine cleavage system transcriptional repressor